MAKYTKVQLDKGVHITFKGRRLIAKVWNPYLDSSNHVSISQAATLLKMDRSTLLRELRRGCPGNQVCFWLPAKNRYQYFKYDPKKAHQNALREAAQKGRRAKVTTAFLKTLQTYLDKWYSLPAAYRAMEADGILKSTHPSQRCIYDYLKRREICLRVHGRPIYAPYKEKKKRAEPRNAANNPYSGSIANIPVYERKANSFAYGEIDTIHSCAKGSGGLLTMWIKIAGKKYAFVRKLKRLDQTEVHQAMRSIMREMHVLGIKINTLVTDNGSEFLNKKAIEGIFNCKLYYTHAYAGWEKGSVENLNGLIRRRYPKGFDFANFTKAQAAELQQWLADYPRPPKNSK